MVGFFLSLTARDTTVPLLSNTKSGSDSTALAFCNFERRSVDKSNTISGLGIVISFSGGAIIIDASA